MFVHLNSEDMKHEDPVSSYLSREGYSHVAEREGLSYLLGPNDGRSKSRFCFSVSDWQAIRQHRSVGSYSMVFTGYVGPPSYETERLLSTWRRYFQEKDKS